MKRLGSTSIDCPDTFPIPPIMHPQAYTPHPPTKIFNVSPSTHPASLPAEDADLAPALQRFDHLTPSEKYTEFQSQAYEIKQLKRKIRKCAKCRAKAVRKAFAKAQETLKTADVELLDQKMMLDHLLQGLDSGRLLPNSLPFDRICTILRNALKQYKGTNAVTTREKQEYEYLPQNSKIVSALMGKRVDENLSAEEIAEQYLLMHAAALKKLTYQQFVDWNERVKAGPRTDL